MASVTKIKEHDWLAVRVRFPSGQQANVTWGRGGETVTVKPDNPALAESLSLIVIESLRRMRAGGYHLADLRVVVDEMERVGKASTTLDGYLDGLRTALRVKGERPQPKGANDAPAETIATVRKSRGWIVDAKFPTGERLELKINASSVGILIDPRIPSREDEVMRFVFGMKQASVMDDEALAHAARDAAQGVGDMVSWVDAFREAVIPTRAPGR